MLSARPHLDRICIAYSAVFIFAPASGGFLIRASAAKQNEFVVIRTVTIHLFKHYRFFLKKRKKKEEFSIWVMAVQDDSEVGRGGK